MRDKRIRYSALLFARVRASRVWTVRNYPLLDFWNRFRPVFPNSPSPLVPAIFLPRIRHVPSTNPPFSFPESAMFLPRIRHFLPSFCHPSLAKFEVKRTISAVLVCRFLPFGPFGSFLSASFQFISTGQVKIHTIEKRKSTKVPCNKNEIIKMKLFVALVGLRACLFILFFILYPLIIEFLQLVQIKRIIN